MSGAYLEELAALAHPEGGWGYGPGQAAHLEPTCLGLLALALEPQRHASVRAKAQRALDESLQHDGSYRLPRGRPEALWPTALALFTRAVLGVASEELSRTAAVLLAVRGRDGDSPEARQVHDIDLTLAGWPWAEGNFSWVEPTSWACLALTRVGLGDHPRVQEGLRLLLDRTFDEGGLNYGNRHILGRPLEPVPGPTALALLALQRHGQEPRVAASVRYLLRVALTSDDLEHLGWAKLALAVHADQPGVRDALPRLDARIIAAHSARPATPWVRPHPLRQALTALALGNGHTLFTLLAVLPSIVPPAVPFRPTPPPRFLERVRLNFGALWQESTREAPPTSAVHVAAVTDYNADLADVLCRQFDGFRDRVPLRGRRVVLKPNLVEYHRDKVINTHPHVVAAVIELCRREGAAEVIVAEGPGHWRNVEYLVAASGLGDVLYHYKVPFVDLNHDEPVKKPNRGRLTGLPYLYLAQTIASADVVISLPKLKTHHWAVATLSLKNLFGTLPGVCYGWPKNELHWRGIDNSIVDIAATRMPDLAIVDGIVGMEGDGPLNGTPKPMGLLVMGTDLLAVDATCCRLMCLDPHKVAYLTLGAGKKLGLIDEGRIEQRGEGVAAQAAPFEIVEHFSDMRSA